MNRRQRLAVLAAMAIAVGLFGWAGRSAAREKTIEDRIKDATTAGPLSRRLAAINWLRSQADPRKLKEWNLVEVMLDLAKNPNPRLARKAISTLGYWARSVDRQVLSQIVAPLLKIAKDKDNCHMIARREAIQVLGLVLKADITHQESIAKLVVIAADRRDDPTVRATALIALGAIGSPRAKQVIRKCISENDEVVSEGAIRALEACLQGPSAEAFVDPGLMGVLLQKLRSAKSSREIREAILKIISSIVRIGGGQSSTAEKMLVEQLDKEKDPDLVIAALEAISYIGGGKVAPGVKKAYERFKGKDDEDAKAVLVRTQACTTAGSLFDHWSQKRRDPKRAAPIPDRAAVSLTEFLCTALKEDPSSEVKKEAAVSLGNLYDKGYDKTKAAMTLIVVLGHEDMGEEIKAAALESLEVLTGRNFEQDVKRWEEWYLKNQRKLTKKPGR